jgi:hypothetical protein
MVKEFKCLDDLSKLSPDDPAHPIIEDLARKLLVTTDSMARPYDPAASGWIVLISDKQDAVRSLTEIWGDDAYSLIEIPWEGVTSQDGFYIAVFLANNDFGLVFVIPDSDWLPDELRNVLEGNLVPSPDKSTNQT